MKEASAPHYEQGEDPRSDIRTSDLVLFAHEKNLAKGLDIKNLIETFAKRKSRRVPLL